MEAHFRKLTAHIFYIYTELSSIASQKNIKHETSNNEEHTLVRTTEHADASSWIPNTLPATLNLCWVAKSR